MSFYYSGLVLILTIIISLVIMVLSEHWAMLQKDKGAGDNNGDRGRSGGAFVPDSLKQKVFDTINKAVDSSGDSLKLTEMILGIVDKESEKILKVKNEELIKQYDAIIHQKEQNEKIARGKYDKVLSDKKDTEAVIRSIAEGLVVVDASGNVIMMNPTAEKLLAISQKDKVGKPIMGDVRKEQLISLITNRPGEEDREVEIKSSEDETRKIIRSSSAIIENENGQTVGMVSVLSDITKQKELDQLKSDFVSKVSHELRTPIITIENSVTLLLGKSLGGITEKQEEFLKIAKRNLERLSVLINDLLFESKLEASEVRLKTKPCSIEKLINDVCDTLNAWTMTKDIKIKKKFQKDLQEIELDYNRMIQVLNNIIGNAIKFTPKKGAIVIEAALEGDKKNVLISVSDTGPGIPEKDLGKIFDKFYQAGDRALTDIAGTGLGLSISREIILLHKGKIWSENNKEGGAKVSFTLPIAAA